MLILDIVDNSNICPNCKTDLNDKDIYEVMLEQYRSGSNPYLKPKEEIIKTINKWPDLYKDFPTGLDEYNIYETNALKAAWMYGWRLNNKKCFSRMIGIELINGYDGIEFWHCPDCKAYWKHFSWSNIEKLREKYDSL